MKSIYTLTAEYAAIMELIEASDGELSDDVEDRLNSLPDEFAEKIERLCEVIEELHAQEVGVTAVIDRLAKQKTVASNGQRRLKDWIKKSLEVMGERKLRAGTFNVSLCKNSQPSVEFSGGDIPERYRRVIVELDKKAVIADWRDGIPVPACCNVEVGFHVRIS